MNTVSSMNTMSYKGYTACIEFDDRDNLEALIHIAASVVAISRTLMRLPLIANQARQRGFPDLAGTDQSDSGLTVQGGFNDREGVSGYKHCKSSGLWNKCNDNFPNIARILFFLLRHSPCRQE